MSMLIVVENPSFPRDEFWVVDVFSGEIVQSCESRVEAQDWAWNHSFTDWDLEVDTGADSLHNTYTAQTQ